MVTLSERFTAYAKPVILLSYSIVHLPLTLLTNPLLAITSPSAFRSKWFESTWKVIGPQMAASPDQIDDIEYLMSRAHGTVLELGPGAGDQMFHFKASKIEKVYGAEPNVYLHDMLVENAKKHGLGGKYHPLEAGAQPGTLLPALKKAGMIPSTLSSLPEDGVFDTIVAVKCMCSAPQDQMPATMAIVQALLKPGGEFLFFEHLPNETDMLSITLTWFLGWIWPAFMGNCHLDGKLDKIIQGMGGWKERDLKIADQYKGFELFRYVRGVCTKA